MGKNLRPENIRIAFCFIFLFITSQFSAPILAQDTEKKIVYAGVFLNDISDVEAKDGVVKVNFDMWLKWEGDKNFSPNLFVQNIYDEDIKELELIHDDETNWNLRRFNVRGSLNCSWNVEFYPFDHHKININLMIDDTSYSKWILRPALSNSGLSNINTVTDWQVYPTLMVDFDTMRNKNITLDQSKEMPKKEMVVFYAEIKRPVLPQFTKIIGPLILITLIGLLALAIPINELEVRTAFAFTALLSIVAYQFTTADAAPDVPYLTIMDFVFIFGYLFVGFALLLIWYCSTIEEERAQNYSKKTFKYIVPFYLALNLFLISSKYVESITGIPEKEAHYIPTNEIVLQDSFVIHNFRKRNLANLDYWWAPPLAQSMGEFDVNYIIPSYPDFRSNTIHFLNTGEMEVYWQIYSNLRWSSGAKLSVKDIAFGFKIEPDTLIKSVEILRDDLLKITYKERVYQPQQRHLPIYPWHFFDGIFKHFGADSVINYRNNYPSPAYGPYFCSLKTDKEVIFKRNPNYPENLSQFRMIKIKILPYDTNIINLHQADKYMKNAILPDYFLTHLRDKNSPYEFGIGDSYDNIVLVNSFNMNQGYESALSNAISKSFNRNDFVSKFFGSELLSEPAYWPVSRNTKYYDSACLHCDEFDKETVLAILKNSGFNYQNGKLLDIQGKQVEMDFYTLQKDLIPKNLGRMYAFLYDKFTDLGIKVDTIILKNPDLRFKAVSESKKFAFFLEYAMNEEVVLKWSSQLKLKDKLMSTMYNRFDREGIRDLRNLLAKRMINYQTTQAHFFVPICTLRPRDTYRKSMGNLWVMPQCQVKDMYKYTKY